MELHEKITTVNWTEKIDKLVFEDAKYIYIFFLHPRMLMFLEPKIQPLRRLWYCLCLD